jgi:DNA helicase-2/ATP-dependent DNA helicase PcrA
MVRKSVLEVSGTAPESIGFFTNWGKGVSIIARALQGDGETKEIRHRVVMDEAEVLLATRVVALCLEPIPDTWQTLASGLELIAELYRARGNVKKVDQLGRNAADARDGRFRGNAKCPKVLKSILDQIKDGYFSGEPARDWVAIRRAFEDSGTQELLLVAKLVIYLMGFNRGRRISDALSEVWLRRGQYEGARALIEAAITEDQIVGGDGDLVGLNVMTMHKSKGKEFDGVVVLHLGNNMSPYAPDWEPAPHKKSRKLLRVAVTRARHHVMMLTDAFSPSPILNGHKL